MANLGSSSLVKADNAALAHDAAILGPIAEAKNATYTIFMNSEAKYTERYHKPTKVLVMN
jgi:hypothetical protein